MKNKKNRGFTLVELIIAMAILGVVLSIGYGIINGSNRSLKEQSDVFNGQMSINTVNKFITKDLEQSKDFIGPLYNGTPLDESQLQNLINSVTSVKEEKYKYTVMTNDNLVIDYEITVSQSNKNNKYVYDIIRIENGGSIDIVSNQPLNVKEGNVQIPITIIKNGSTYGIELGYEYKSKQKVYEFSVSSRYM